MPPIALLLVLLTTGCSGLDPVAASLRITNAGPEPIVGLTVYSPGSQVEFGTIAPGATSEHRVMPGGVYRYAAFRFTHDGQPVEQPVIDFVGEEPERGREFTYTLRVSTDPQPFLVIMSVVRDR